MAFTKSHLINSTTWTFGGYVVSQLIRLAGNILLARLIMPDVFGFMALVFTLIQGVEMFSDLGLGPSIIQNKMGEKPEFLRTAWTIQIIRGSFIWLLISLFAYPLSLFYSQPLLLYILPIIGFCNLLQSFNSPMIHVYNRHMNLQKLILFDLITQALSLMILLIAAYFYPTVWALVLGSIAHAVIRVIWSYFYFPGFTPSLEMDPEAKKEIIHFGTGVFFSSILNYFANQLDILSIGYLFSLHTLGIYSISLSLSKAPLEVCRVIGNKIGFPWLSDHHRNEGIDTHKLFNMRVRLLIPFVILQLFLFYFSETIIKTIYREEYWDASWMLKWLALGNIATLVNFTSSVVWLATGQTKKLALLMFLHILLYGPLLYFGYHFGGETGVIIAIALIELFYYPIQSIFLFKEGLWQPYLDIPVLGLAYGTAYFLS